MKRYYWAVEFLGGNRTCTTGGPNKKTGRMSMAIDYTAFTTSADRDNWVDRAKQGKERISATLREIRGMQLGSSVQDFNEEIENIIWRVENSY